MNTISDRLVCGGCSRPWDPFVRACQACDTTYPINLNPPPVIPLGPDPIPPGTLPKCRLPGIRVCGLEGVKDLAPVQYYAEISRALRGIVTGSTIFLWGLPGAGKSTLAAELGAAMAEEREGHCYWLDMEQLTPSLIKACFARVGAPTDRVRVVSPRHPRDPLYAPVTWRDALAAIPTEDRDVIVVDSLQTWAGPSYIEQAALMREVQGLGPTVVVISHANKKGEAAGRATNLHAGDANVTVLPDRIVVTKCRWSPCPTEILRVSTYDPAMHG